MWAALFPTGCIHAAREDHAVVDSGVPVPSRERRAETVRRRLSRRMPMSCRQNAFDLVRLAAAWLVLYSHSFPIYGLAEPRLFGDSVGKLAVGVFFAVSGYLVCESWERDPSAPRFAMRRVLRIMPGLMVSLAFVVLIVGLLCTDLPPIRYLQHPQTWSYVFSNALLIAGSEQLPGVFRQHPISLVNGSLWTLRYEVLMYVALVLLAQTRHLRWASLTAFATCLISAWVITAHGHANLSIPLPIVWRLGLEFDGLRLARLGCFFFGGCALYLLRHRVKLSPLWALSIVLLASLADSPVLQTLILGFGVPYVTLVVALACPPVRRIATGTDISYGVYVYAYPIQQVVAEYGLRNGSGWLGTITASTLLTYLVAQLSWRYVEKPALKMKPMTPETRRERRIISPANERGQT